MSDKSNAGDPERIDDYAIYAQLGASDPRRIDKYKILAILGKGGSGVVYLASHVYLQRLYAIKLFNSRPESSQEGKDSDEVLSLLDKMLFLSEASSLDKLQGPHILSVIDVGFYEDKPYIVTEYVKNGSLRNLLPKRPPVERSLTILSDVDKALTAIHNRNIVHGDLKPENIFLSETDEALLGDFGNATDLGEKEIAFSPVIKGTYPYMAPEQFQGYICRKSDQYALGCIAYELFTGQHPFGASGFEIWDRQTWQKKHENEKPRRLREIVPDLEANIEVATLTALAKEPDRRHTDIHTFVQELHTTTNSSRPAIASSMPQRPREVETAPPTLKNAAINTATPTIVQQLNAIINNVPAPASPISTPATRPQDRPPSLYELQLSDPFKKLLDPILKGSLSTEELSARHPNKSKLYTYTALTKNKTPLRCLLHIDDKFLTNEYEDNLIVMLEAFKPDQHLIFFLDTDHPSLELRILFKRTRKNNVNYIIKSELEKRFSRSKEYELLLADALELEDDDLEDDDEVKETKDTLPPDQLEPDDAEDLVRILSNYAQGKGDYSRFWLQVFETDGLRNRKGGFKFDNQSDTVARDIVVGLMSLFVNVKNEKRDALGLLLTRLLNQKSYPDFPEDHRPKVLAIIDKYQLVPQDEYHKLKGDNP